MVYLTSESLVLLGFTAAKLLEVSTSPAATQMFHVRMLDEYY